MNMCVRPRTTCHMAIVSDTGVSVRFRLGKSDRRRGESMTPRHLYGSWSFVGAALVDNYRPEIHRNAYVAKDPTLIFNVLGRIRGNLLLADAPLVLEPGFLERDIVSDDRRLAWLAGAIR